MATGSGLGSSVGVVAETTYDTFVAPNRFFSAKSFNVKKINNTQPTTGVMAGRPAPLDEVVTTTAATGQIQADVLRKGFGLLLAHTMGSTAAPVQQGATAAYLQTHTLGDNYGRSLTMQASLPTTAGSAAAPRTATGCKITQAQFSCSVDGLVEATFDFDARSYSEAQALAAASEIANNPPFHGGEMIVRLGSFGAEAAVQGVRTANLTISRPQDVARFYAGNQGKKSEPVWNDSMAVSGTIEIDNVSPADFHDRFVAHTATSLVVEWVGQTAIAGAFFPTLGFQMPRTYFGDGIFEVSGPDVIKGSIPFMSYFDATNGLVTARYMSTDIAV